ncbi:DNA polymerase III subunit epsilon [Hyphomicrobium methylovorum]|uniref:DNA polymerase III subunit epsilon n=1 Tax=Hyphomicrobium methylovorum TaxID=84 RepID=UPI0015E7B180|nr:DNA polymerase III subunit epsilon [Hyphomicrobium methylovorum]
MREIVLDTETTGLDPKTGDRLIEIGAVELFNRIPTGREYHCFINPERNVPEEAQRIHGISTEFLIGKPLFRDVMKDFLAFIGDDQLVIHNAQFDVMFLNFELQRERQNPLSFDRVVDTLALARRRHPAGPNSLDALCKRYGIDNSKRTKHGALVDSLLLAEVYVELLGERQATFGLQTANTALASADRRPGKRVAAKARPTPLPSRVTEADVAAHHAFIEAMGEKSLWLRIWEKVRAA